MNKPEILDSVNFEDVEKSSSLVADIIGESKDVQYKLKLDEIIDEQIIILGYKLMTGQRGDYIFIYFLRKGTPGLHGVATGAKVVTEKLNKIKNAGKLPVKAIIIDKGEYYDII
jgi:hypothetical protein